MPQTTLTVKLPTDLTCIGVGNSEVEAMVALQESLDRAGDFIEQLTDDPSQES